MIAARRLQRSFADGLIAEEVKDLWEPWMRHADEALNDDQVAEDHSGGVEQALQKEQDARTTVNTGRNRSPDVVAQTYARLELRGCDA